MYVIVNYFSLINESNHTCIFSCIYGFLRKNIVKLYTYLYSIFIFHKVRVPFCWIWSRNYRALVNILRLGGHNFFMKFGGSQNFLDFFTILWASQSWHLISPNIGGPCPPTNKGPVGIYRSKYELLTGFEKWGDKNIFIELSSSTLHFWILYHV